MSKHTPIMELSASEWTVKKDGDSWFFDKKDKSGAKFKQKIRLPIAKFTVAKVGREWIVDFKKEIPIEELEEWLTGGKANGKNKRSSVSS